MGATGRTPNQNIPIFTGDDTTGWKNGFNPAMNRIDELITEVKADGSAQGTAFSALKVSVSDLQAKVNEQAGIISANGTDIEHLQTDVANAQSAAELANTKASSAQALATTAADTAGDALSAATNAQTAANKAQSTATSAKNTAEYTRDTFYNNQTANFSINIPTTDLEAVPVTLGSVPSGTVTFIIKNKTGESPTNISNFSFTLVDGTEANYIDCFTDLPTNNLVIGEGLFFDGLGGSTAKLATVMLVGRNLFTVVFNEPVEFTSTLGYAILTIHYRIPHFAG